MLNWKLNEESLKKVSFENTGNTWEHWESNREKYIIFHRQNEISLLKSGKYLFYGELQSFSLEEDKRDIFMLLAQYFVEGIFFDML